MTRLRSSRRILLAALGAAAVHSACSRAGDANQRYFRVREIGLELPELAGWIPDRSIRVDDPAKGGVIFRLVRQGAIAGSPRIDVEVEPLRPHPAAADSFLADYLRATAALEQAGQIRITTVEHRAMRIGPRKGFRVHHEYTLGRAPNEVSITQVATLLVLDGRGVAVTALGRTELLRPLAASIEKILDGVRTPVSAASETPAERPPVTPGKSPDAVVPAPRSPPASLTEPVDLGKLGGH